MKLMLTSKGLSNKKFTRSFLKLLAKKPEDTSVCIITTAATNQKSSHPRIKQAKEIFLQLGIHQVDFLDVEMDDPIHLLKYQCIYIAGGDPVFLLKHIHRSGAHVILKEIAERNILIIGVSAGTIALGPHLKIINHFTPDLFVTEADFSLAGVGLFDFPIMPHADRKDIFPSSHTISERIEQYEQKFNEQVVLLPDDEVIITDSVNKTFYRLN